MIIDNSLVFFPLSPQLLRNDNAWSAAAGVDHTRAAATRPKRLSCALDTSREEHLHHFAFRAQEGEERVTVGRERSGGGSSDLVKSNGFPNHNREHFIKVFSFINELFLPLSLSLLRSTAGVPFEAYSVSLVLPPATPKTSVLLSGKPLESGVLFVKGVSMCCTDFIDDLYIVDCTLFFLLQ